MRNAYLQRAYPEAYAGQNKATLSFRYALRLNDLTPEQRETVTALAADYRDNSDRLSDQFMDAIDENRKTSSMFDFDSERRRKLEEKLDSLREKRTAISTAASDALKGVLGPDLVAKVDKHVAEAKDDAGDSQTVRTFAVTGGPGGMSAVQVQVSAPLAATGDVAAMGDPFIPTAITERNIAQYAAILGINEDRRAILDTLHEDYRDKFRAIEDGDIKAAREASQNLWASGQNGQMKAPTPEAIDRLYDMRRAALTAILALDGSFFDDVQTTLLKPEDNEILQRVRLMRQRDVYNRGNTGAAMNFGGRSFGGRRGGDGGPGPGGGGRGQRGADRGPGGPGGTRVNFFGGGSGSSEESSIDLSSLVDRLNLAADDRAKSDGVLIEYERTVADDFRRHYEAAMKMQQSMDKMMAQNFADRNDQGNGQRRGQGGPGGGGNSGPGGNNGPGGGGGDRARDGLRQLMDGDGRTARQAADEIATLNRSTLPRLIEALPPAAGESLRMEYNKRAFPGVYRDSRSADAHLTAAKALDDLSPPQRSAIDNIVAEYRPAYEQYCDQMVKLSAAQPDLSGPPDQRNWQAYQEQQRQLEKITFDRNELSDKALAKLRAALNDDQVARLGLKDEAPR